MKRLIKTLLLSAVLLSGCATRNVSSSYTLDPNGSKGIIVASVTYQGAYSGYGVFYRNMNASGGRPALLEAGQGMMLIPIPEKSDFGSAAKGKLIVAELMPGDYEVFDWRVSSGPATVTPRNKFSVRFKVEPGKAVYLGNFDFLQTARLGLTVTGAELSLRGEMERDLAVLRDKYPTLSDIQFSAAASSGALISRLGGVDGVHFDIRVPR
ncbi:hypothetical protein GCM10027296_22620 [Chitinimonas naiadis]